MWQAAGLSPVPPEQAPAGTPSPLTRVLRAVAAHAKKRQVGAHHPQRFN